MVLRIILLPLHVRMKNERLIFLTQSIEDLGLPYNCCLQWSHFTAESFCPSWSFEFLVRRKQKSPPNPANFSEQSRRKNKPQSKIPSPTPGMVKATHIIASQMHSHCAPKMKSIGENKGEFRQRKSEKGKTEFALLAKMQKTFCRKFQWTRCTAGHPAKDNLWELSDYRKTIKK